MILIVNSVKYKKQIFNFFLLALVANVCFEVNAQGRNYWYNKFYAKMGVGAFLPTNKFKNKNGDEDPYVAKKPKNTAVYNIGIGYKITGNIRSDLNFSYRRLRYKAIDLEDDQLLSQKIKIYSVFLNGYYDFNFHRVIKPYLSIGIGYASNKGNLSQANVDGVNIYGGSSKNNLVWNVGFGHKFMVNRRLGLDFSYRYVDLGKTKTKPSATVPGSQPSSQKIKAHEIMGGVIVNL